MEQLKKVWAALDGHKSQIALAFYMFQDQIIPIWFSNGMPVLFEKTLLTIAVILGGLGLGHAMVKEVSK